MSMDRQPAPEAKSVNWNKFIELVRRHTPKPDAPRWYVFRAEQFLRSVGRRALSELEPRDIVHYFESVKQGETLKQWQFLQAVDSIRFLCQTVGVRWLDEVDWAFLRESAPLQGETDSSLDCSPASNAARTWAANSSATLPTIKRRFLDHFEALSIEIRRREYSLRTDQAYSDWLARLVLFCGQRDPELLNADDIRAYLEHLAVVHNVAASTQNQALNALVFFYDQVLNRNIGGVEQFARAKRRKPLPVALTVLEVNQLLEHLEGRHLLLASLLYGSGMRLLECVRLRVQDIDFGCRQITVRGGKGRKDRVVPLPVTLAERLKVELEITKQLHQRDLAHGLGEVALPAALATATPEVAREWGWQFAFPSGRISFDPRTGRNHRHHMHESGLQKAVKQASRAAGIVKNVGCHTLRHTFATHLLDAGTDIRTVQELLGHSEVSTTLIYTRSVLRGWRVARSPADETLSKNWRVRETHPNYVVPARAVGC